MVKLFDRLFGRRGRAPELDPPPARPPDGFEVGVESFCWRVLCHAYVRVLARQAGRDWTTISERDMAAMLDPYHRDLERDAKMLRAAIVQARHEGVSTVQRALHRAEGLDHEMVDQAILYAHETMRSEPTNTKARKR